MLWIALGIVLLSLVFLALVLRTLPPRLNALRQAQLRLAESAEAAQGLASAAQGLQAHSDSLKTRIELAQQQLATIKGTEPAETAG